MGAATIFETPKDPAALNAYYLHAPITIHQMDGVKKLNEKKWFSKYSGSVTPYDVTGKGVQQRIITFESRRGNPRFCTDWSLWHNGCGPQNFEPQQVSRPGASEKFAHLMHMEKQTEWYQLESIVANALNLPKQLEKDMMFLATLRMDTYAEYFRQMHLNHCDRHWVGLNDATPANRWVNRSVPGEAPNTAPWRWGSDADGCRFCGEKIFLHPDVDPTKVLPLTQAHLRAIQRDYAHVGQTHMLEPLRIITDVMTADAVARSNETTVNALLYRLYGSGGNLNPSLSADKNVAEFADWEIDSLPWRGYYDPEQETESGEHCIVQINPFLDNETNVQGIESDMNPDYEDPAIAAFQVDVPWYGPTYDPMRAIVPSKVSKIANHPINYSHWEWINNRDMQHNPKGKAGYFSMEDNMMSLPTALARVAPAILCRRMPDDVIFDGTLPTLAAAELADEADTTDCDDVRWKSYDPDCAQSNPLVLSGDACGTCV